MVKLALHCAGFLSAAVSLSLVVSTDSRAQTTNTRFNPAEREPLMRASIAVELIPSANAEDGDENIDTLDQQEHELKKMEAELLKALSGAAQESGERVGAKRSISPNAVTQSSRETVQKVVVKESSPTLKEYPVAQSGTSEQSKPLQDIQLHPALVTNRGTASSNSRAATTTASQKNTRSENGALTGAPTDVGQKLAIAESQVKILSRELDLSRRSLSSAEERIDELASIVRASQPAKTKGSVALSDAPSGNRGSMSNSAIGAEQEDKFAVSGPSHSGFVSGSAVSGSAIDYKDYDPSLRDSSIATIAADRAPLRVAPGKQESAIFVLPRQSEVTVEYRSGEWYRIMTQAGLRGWVYGSSLRFDTGVSPVSAVRVGGVRASYEAVAFR